MTDEDARLQLLDLLRGLPTMVEGYELGGVIVSDGIGAICEQAGRLLNIDHRSAVKFIGNAVDTTAYPSWMPYQARDQIAWLKEILQHPARRVRVTEAEAEQAYVTLLTEMQALVTSVEGR
jgi:hypothetical protein